MQIFTVHLSHGREKHSMNSNLVPYHSRMFQSALRSTIKAAARTGFSVWISYLFWAVGIQIWKKSAIMALSPFYDPFFRPSRLLNQQFGLGLDPEDLFSPILPLESTRGPLGYYRPWLSSAAAGDVGSTISFDKDKFQVSYCFFNVNVIRRY